MSKHISADDLVPVAMNIILNAGDARNYCHEAFQLAKEGKFKDAHAKMEDAVKSVTTAHQAQTEVIQAEARGDKHEVNILFIHAQDTLMTIQSERIMTQRMIEMLETLANK